MGLADRRHARHRRHPQARPVRLRPRPPPRFYYFVWIVAFACMLLARNLVDSRTGLMLRAMRDPAPRRPRSAIDLQWLRTRVFVLCALFGSLAGSLFAHHVVLRQHRELHRRPLDQLPADPGDRRRDLDLRRRGGRAVRHLRARVPERLGDIHQILFGLALVAVVVAAAGRADRRRSARLRNAARRRGEAAMAPEPIADARRGRPQLRRPAPCCAASPSTCPRAASSG